MWKMHLDVHVGLSSHAPSRRFPLAISYRCLRTGSCSSRDRCNCGIRRQDLVAYAHCTPAHKSRDARLQGAQLQSSLCTRQAQVHQTCASQQTCTMPGGKGSTACCLHCGTQCTSGTKQPCTWLRTFRHCPSECPRRWAPGCKARDRRSARPSHWRRSSRGRSGGRGPAGVAVRPVRPRELGGGAGRLGTHRHHGYNAVMIDFLPDVLRYLGSLNLVLGSFPVFD